MQNEIYEINEKITEIVLALNKTRYYTFQNNINIHSFKINGLIYITLETFVKIVEEVSGVMVPRDTNKLFNWLKQQVYVENVANASQMMFIVCLNFLDAKIVASVKNIIIECGGISKGQIKKSNRFDLDDADLYKKILEDDDFLYKQLRKNSNTTMNHLLNVPVDPYDTILNKRKNNVFSDEETEILKSKKLFSTDSKFNEIFELSKFNMGTDGKFFNPTIHSARDMRDFHNHQNSMITQGMVKPFSKPRGKQMEDLDTKDRPFICKVPGCKRAFKRFEHLKRHNKMHTGEKPFVCKYPGCNKGFSRSDNLNAHYKTHNLSSKNVESLNQTHKETTHHIDFDAF